MHAGRTQCSPEGYATAAERRDAGRGLPNRGAPTAPDAAMPAAAAIPDDPYALAHVYEQAHVGIGLTDALGRFLRVNKELGALAGVAPPQLLGAPFADFTHPDDRDADLDRYRRLWTGEIEPYRQEKRVIRPDGSSLWVMLAASVVRDSRDMPLYGVRVIQDISDRKAMETALLEQTRRLEMMNQVVTRLASELELQKLVQTVTDAGVALSGAAFGAFFYNVEDEQGQSYTLYTLSGAPREAFAAFPMPRATAVFRPTFTGQGVVRSDDITKDPRYGRSEPHRGMPPGHLPVRSYLAIPVKSRSGVVLGGLFFGHPEAGRFSEHTEGTMTAIASQAAVAIDNALLYQGAQREIAVRRQAEERLTLAAAEIDHRARNILSVIQAMANLTRGETIDEFKKTLQGRISALGRAHTLLSESRWEGADLRRLAEDELAAYMSPRDGRAAISGETVKLSPMAAQSISMALHELATNALKHGGLSARGGRVTLEWCVNAERLSIRWLEQCTATVAHPNHDGFGMKLLRRAIRRQLGGTVDIDWKPEGLACVMEFPLDRISRQP